MRTADGQGVITYNGEVYNFLALRDELEREGVGFHSHTDTEVVLYALHLWGAERAVARLNGMFAFAYFDRRDGTLWLGRDRMGIKPLYVARTAAGVVFGSEVKALLAHPRVSCRPDVQALIAHLVYERLDGNWTPFEGIEALHPGTLLRINGSIQTIVYFDVLRDLDPQRILAGEKDTLDEQLRRFEQCFDASVQLHLQSDAPLAVMCSGGLDSGLVTAAARMHKPDTVAYVADIDGVKDSEVERAQRVCEHVGVDLRAVPVDSGTYDRMWPQAVYAYDRPNHFPQNMAAMAVAEAIHADGYKVVLNGDGADELFGGYDWYVSAYRTWRRRRLQAFWIPDHALFRKLGRLVPRLAPPDLDALAARPFAAAAGWHERGLLTRVDCTLDADKRHQREAALFRKLAPLPLHEERAFLARSFDDICIHLAEVLRSNDRMAMWYSVEARVPFVENALIDFGLHLPCRAKYHRGRTKRLIHALAMQRLPQKVVGLKKIGFDVSDQLLYGMEGFLRDGRVAELLKWRRADQDEILRTARTVRRFVFRLVGVELWCRIFLDGDSPAVLTDHLQCHRHRT
jgi:asparagine synthase (glutamine-hydrolysing)